MKNPKTRIGEEFRPSPQFRKLYYLYLIVAIVILILPWQIPLLVFLPPLILFFISLFLSVPILLILIFIAYWIRKYYDSIIYRLDTNDITWRRGVWFKKTGIVPYNRITNVDISQGPISRKLGIAALKIQTAGYSGSTTATAEIRLEGIEDFEELRAAIMGFVRGRKPVAVETYDEGDVDSKILNELVKIRKLLSKSS